MGTFKKNEGAIRRACYLARCKLETYYKLSPLATCTTILDPGKNIHFYYNTWKGHQDWINFVEEHFRDAYNHYRDKNTLTCNSRNGDNRNTIQDDDDDFSNVGVDTQNTEIKSYNEIDECLSMKQQKFDEGTTLLTWWMRHQRHIKERV
jgi:hypothetical protein